MRHLLACLSLIVAFGLTGCAGKEVITSPEAPSSKFTGTSYFESGREMFISVDVRAARLGKPRNMLPLYGVLVRLKGNDPIFFGRESFVLELPDRSRVPLVAYDEFADDYSRSQADRRALGSFLDSIRGKFPEPPYSWLSLDFFPRRGSSVFPREAVDLRAQQLTHGYLYFRLPDDPPLDGRYQLLITPQRSDTTYVINFSPFKEDRKS